MSHLNVYSTIKLVVPYLRVSTDMQAEKYSLPAQDKLLRDIAEQHGWGIVKVYRDEGYSGSLIEKRPDFFTLLQDAAKRRFDAVLVTDFDRLTRPDNLRDLGRIQEVFIQNDIKIVTLSDVIDLSNDDQWFLASLLGIVATKEKKKIIARMKRGIQAKKEAGWFYGGIAPSGYKWDDHGKLMLREVTETFQGEKRQYTCYDWHTVRTIFDLYLYQDVSLKAICQRFDIYFNTLVDILDRAWFYAGYSIQTRSRAEWAMPGKKEPREQLAPGKHSAILTEEEARQTLEKRKTVGIAQERTRQKFPCVGLLRCGVCGRHMYVYRALKTPKHGPRRTYFYYICQTRHGAQKWFLRQKGIELESCGMPFVRADAVEKAAWQALEVFVSSPQMVLNQVGNARHQIALLEKELEGIEKERSDYIRRQSRLLDRYEKADSAELAELDTRMERYKAAVKKLERQRQECEKRIAAHRQQQVDPDQISRTLSQIEEIIRWASPEHRQEIFRSLFCEMVVKPDKTLEVSAKLPTAGVTQRLSVMLRSTKDEEGEGKVYSDTAQQHPLADHIDKPLLLCMVVPLDAA